MTTLIAFTLTLAAAVLFVWLCLGIVVGVLLWSEIREATLDRIHDLRNLIYRKRFVR